MDNMKIVVLIFAKIFQLMTKRISVTNEEHTPQVGDVVI